MTGICSMLRTSDMVYRSLNECHVVHVESQIDIRRVILGDASYYVIGFLMVHESIKLWCYWHHTCSCASLYSSLDEAKVVVESMWHSYFFNSG